MAPLWATQPFKGIYTLLFGVKTALSLPIISFSYIFKSFRPVSGWNYRLCFGVALIRVVFRYYTAIRYQHPRQLKAGKSGDRFALIPPPDSTFFSGALVSKDIEPAPVGAIWHPAPVRKDQGRGQKVVIQFAGGAFVLGWEPNGMAKSVYDTISPHFKTAKILYTQYRLAGSGTHFPAPLQDALTAYNYVLGLGVAPEDIILCGDSAGGNIVLGLLRYLAAFPEKLPSPGNAMIWSPWVHITRQAGKDFMDSQNSDVDFLYAPTLDWGVEEYIPKGDLTPEAQGLISPLHQPFKTATRIFIQAGEVEGFRSAIFEFAEEMTSVKGNQIKYHESKLAPHDILLSNFILRMDAQVDASLKEARAFFEGEVLG
ncbi:alpha/beta-hydrolase [Daldinia sp. FL1419]|nr:alpha/beta-hydrolase [Daldinia sp. FL1419]